jgi:hypothetical protein
MDASQLATAGVHPGDTINLDQLQARLNKARDLFFMRALVRALEERRASDAVLRFHRAARDRLSRELGQGGAT